MQRALSARQGSEEEQTPNMSLATKSLEQKGSGTRPASEQATNYLDNQRT